MGMNRNEILVPRETRNFEEVEIITEKLFKIGSSENPV